MNGASLRDFDRLADRIRLHRQVDKRPVVITEGPSDERILKRAFGEGVSYFAAGSRDSALEEAQKLHDWKQAYFACVVDRDFDDMVEQFENHQAPIHAYENADLEAMIAVSGAAAALIEEFGSSNKITERGGISLIMERLYEMVLPVTRLRRANVENSWGLAFDNVDLRSKVDKKSMELKIQSYCAALSQTSDEAPGQQILMQYATGQRALRRIPSCPRGATPYFRGRDFLSFISVALCGYCGTRRSQSVEPETLEATLRLDGVHRLKQSIWGQDLVNAIFPKVADN